MGKTNTRIPMSVKMRAKQFAMFDALKGLTEAIAEKERQFTPKRELAEDRIQEINSILLTLNPQQVVAVEYYCQYEMRYKKLSGTVKKIDSYWKELQIDETSISFSEISNIDIIEKESPVAKVILI